MNAVPGPVLPPVPPPPVMPPVSDRSSPAVPWRRVGSLAAAAGLIAASLVFDLEPLSIVALVFVLVVPFEKLFPRHRGQRLRRDGVGTDLAFARSQPLLGVVTVAVAFPIGVLSLAWLPGLALSPLVAAIPAPLLPVVGIALFDLAIYWVHRWSHEVPFLHCSNYATFLPVWDRLFGTSFMPPDRRPAVYGVRQPIPRGITAPLGHPLRGMGNPLRVLRHPVRSMRAGFRFTRALSADIRRSTRRPTRGDLAVEVDLGRRGDRSGSALTPDSAGVTGPRSRG